MRCQSHDANNLQKTKKKKPLGGFVPLLLPRAAATFPLSWGGLLFRYFWQLCKDKLQHLAGMVAHGCSCARGASQGDRRPKRGLSPRHSSPKPCQKPHPCQHRHKQPELAAFASSQSNSPLLCSKLPAQGSALKVQPCLHAPFL